ncbi:hypothetical protein AAW12_16080 [Sphingobacterium sp. Ag1]|uniref:hypothetical protein n=1 Tax=Sphingobacterium sp. Ag1 TaxID=1643451 RepID=UPI0006278BE1|nr:hypothetical protein [Sphingobacterium sp. Ag1]KKO90593.1 hypothetical protein AAW12_16080 [Sphingobacterium sp. Ag1]
MSEYRIDIQDIFDATNGGLDIIIDLYPDAEESARNRNKKFKLRTEKTASANLFKNQNDIWIVTDFGGGQEAKGKNAVEFYRTENGIDFVTAINELALRYNVQGADPSKAPKPIKTTQPAASDQDEKQYYYKVKETLSEKEIEHLFPRYALTAIGWRTGADDHAVNARKAAAKKVHEVCKKYNFWALESYSYIDNRIANVYSSTDDYPMFAWIEKLNDKETFAKIYVPKHINKGNRFRYSGQRPKDFLHGLSQAQQEFRRRELEAEKDNKSDDEETDHEGNPLPSKKKKVVAEKIDELLYLSGGSDALTAALLGYWVTWPNSETATLTQQQYWNMSYIADKVIQLQDIDDTGIAQAHIKAMDYLDLLTAELPKELTKKKDRRGGSCKDLRDFFNHYKNQDFKAVLNTALPYRFWDIRPKFSGKGEDRIQTGFTFDFNNVHAYNFLGKNGFYRLNSPAEKNGYMFIKIEGNIVTKIEPNEVKNFVHNFLQERRLSTDLRNAMYRTTQLSENSLSNLPLIEVDFNDTGKHEQFYMFPNTTLRITAAGIEQYNPGSVKRFIWKEDVIEHHFKLNKEEPFTIWMDDNTGQYDIRINTKDDLFLNYLIQTSRIHWRTELETRLQNLSPAEREEYKKENKFNIAGPLLTPEEITEQKLHLINKIFAIGYMMHRFKDPDKPWCIFGMDNKINEDGGSYGGSGKSIALNIALSKVMRKRFYIGGRNPKITENQFIYHGLTEYHRYVCIDDAHEYLNFHFFFDVITGSLTVNPKNTAPYEIPYAKVAKFCISSNYTLRDIDPSVERRILYTVFSDYYHNKGERDDYNEIRKPSHDFGKNLFDDFTREEWNAFYNTMMYCVRFYLTVAEKLDPPMSNVNIRNLKAEMGPDFEEWAAAYFDEGSTNVDRLIVREEAFKDFDYKYRKGWKTQRFSKALRAFCKLNNYELSPKELHNSKGNRIIHKTPEKQIQRDGSWTETGRMVSKEFMYIKTKHDVPLNVNVDPVAAKEAMNRHVDLPPVPKDKQEQINF